MKKQGTNIKPSFFFSFLGFFSLGFLSNCRRTFSEVIVKGGGYIWREFKFDPPPLTQCYNLSASFSELEHNFMINMKIFFFVRGFSKNVL